MSEPFVPFQDNREFLEAELAYLERVVRAYLTRTSSPASVPGPESLRGLYLSEVEMLRLFTVDKFGDEAAAMDLTTQARELCADIDQRRKAGLLAGADYRLARLSRLFSLTDWEEQLILLCLAPELDPRYEKLYAFLNDDLTRKCPTQHLALILFRDAQAERVASWSNSHVFKAGILRAEDEAGSSSRLTRLLHLDERISSYLLGSDDLPETLKPFARLVAPLPATPGMDAALMRSSSSLLEESATSAIVTAIREHLDQAQAQRILIHITGPGGVGKHALAESICAQLDTPLLVINLAELAGLNESLEAALRLAAREALLQPAALYLEGFDRLLPYANTRLELEERIAAPAEPAQLGTLMRVLEDFSWLTFLAGEKPFAPAEGSRWQNHILLHVELPAPDDAARGALWADSLAAFGISIPPTEVDALAGRFRFTRGQIQAALQAAQDSARLKPLLERRITASDVARACRQQSGPVLVGLAQRIETRYDWHDIVLTANALAQMHEMCTQVRHRRQVYGEWGFGEKLARGNGLAALFSGPSGTGKTMAAEIIAGDLELDLYRIDLSSVVSKYIGETEKNLAKIFAEAERASAVLFFDEADALFGKRSEVKDAHDRYANIEISYLLQRIEAYEGVVILATNMKKNIDEAFIRRLHFLVDFPFPDENQRAQIWRGLFPVKAPRSPDLDFDFLAERLPLAGGNIKNIVLHAAFLAAADGGSIGMDHIIHAAKREYDKIGRLGSENDFGPYWSLMKDGEK